MNTSEALRNYKPVLDDINRKYSNAQIRAKTYKINGQDTQVDDYTIYELRNINSSYKKQIKRDVLSGVEHELYPNAHTYSSSHHDSDEVTEANYQHIPSSDMKALIENAELKAELRFTKQRLEEKEAELNNLKNQGLGSIEQRTEWEFLKRDHRALQEKYDGLQKEYDKVVPELDELLESRKGFERFKEILETFSENKEVLMGAIAAINPQLGQRMGGLAGIEAGAANPETQKAVELGMMIINNFQGNDFNLLRDLINIFHAHKEVLKESHYLTIQRLQQKMQNAPKVGEEDMPEEFKNAKTI